MEGFPSSHAIVRFGGFELDQHAGELRKDGTRIRLQEQPLQILRILLEHPGTIITREELRQRIWPSDTFVDFDHGINNAIKRLREALGDTAETPGFIETLPRRGYRFIAAIEDMPSKLRMGTPIDSIAVFPFETASSDPDTDYLAIGIPGSVTHALSQIPKLRVISWRRAANEESCKSDPLAIGRRLGVRAVLTGTIWQRGSKLRLHVDLLGTSNGEEIWGDQYDSDLTELFAVQDSISREVSHKLRLRMTGEAENRLVKRHTENIEAYQLYVRARRWCEKRSAEGFRRGVEYLSQAIQIDPDYAPAHAEMASAYRSHVTTAPLTLMSPIRERELARYVHWKLIPIWPKAMRSWRTFCKPMTGTGETRRGNFNARSSSIRITPPPTTITPTFSPN
jgi:TolB-like protein